MIELRELTIDDADAYYGVLVLDRLRFERVADFETYSRFLLKVPGTPG